MLPGELEKWLVELGEPKYRDTAGFQLAAQTGS